MIGSKLKRIATISLAMFMVFSVIQIMPFELDVVENASAGSTWLEDDWSGAGGYDYGNSSHIDATTNPGEVRIAYEPELIITDAMNRRIVKTKIDGSGWQTNGSQGTGQWEYGRPASLSYDKDTGFIYIIDRDNDHITRSRIDGTGWLTYGTTGAGVGNFNDSRGIDHDPLTGYVYVADRINNRIVKTTMNGSYWQSYDGGGSPFSGPVGIKLYNETGLEELYVAERTNSRIVKTNMIGGGWTAYGSWGTGSGQFNWPSDLFFDNSSGTEWIYVADEFNNRIVKTQIDGTGWTTLGTFGSGVGKFDQPRGIYYNNVTGFLYITDSGNDRIVKTKMDGTGWETFGTSGSGVGQFTAPHGIDVGNFSYLTNGTLSSKSFNVGPNSFLKNITWNANVPANTGLKLRIKSADSKVNLSLKSFVGPDGGTGTYYTTSGQDIWAGHFGDAFIQYKVYLNTSDDTITPILYNISINYNLFPAPPTPTAPPDDSWTSDNTPTYNWSFVDYDPGNYQTSFQFQLDNDTGFVIPNNDTSELVSGISSYTSTSPIGDGKWYWRVRTKDDDGNWSTYSNPWALNIDTQPPTSSISVPVNGVFYNTLTTISGTASDGTGIGITTVEIMIIRNSDGWHWNGTGWNSTPTWLLVSGTTAWNYDTSAVSWTSGLQYTVISQANDSLNNLETFGAGNTFNFDNETPTSTIINPADTTYHNSLPMISGSASDTGGAGVDHVNISIKNNADSLYWSGSAWVGSETWLNVTGTTTWSKSSGLPTWVSGNNYTLRSRATDNISNVETPSTGTTFYFDLDLPTSLITAPINDTWYNSLISITGTSADTGGAGVDYVNVSIKNDTSGLYWDGAAWGVSEAWLAVTSTTFWFKNSGLPVWVSGNTYTVSSRATDIVPNVEVPGLGTTFYFDNDIPTSAITTPANNTFLNTLTSISGSALDTGGSNLNIVQLEIKRTSDGATWNGTGWNNTVQTWLNTTGTTAWSYDTSGVTWTSEEWFEIRASAEDNASNLEIPTDWTAFYFDDIPPSPVSIIINNGSTYTNTTSITLNLTTFDSGSGVNHVAYSDNGLVWTPWEPYTQYRPYTLPSVDGSKRVYYKVQDLANNTVIVSDTIILDTTPPMFLSILINSDATYTNSTQVNLDLGATDLGSGLNRMAFGTDGITWTPWESFNTFKTFNLPAGDGPKFVFFMVEDRANNTAQSADSIILDTVAPENLFILFNNGDNYTNIVYLDLALNATDETSGVYQMSFSTNGTDWSEWGDFATSLSPTILGPDGLYTFYFRVKDYANNIAEPVNDSIYLDRLAPDPVTITINDDEVYTNLEIVDLTLFAEDLGSGINRVSYSTDNIVWTDWEAYGTTKQITLPTGDGVKSVYFRVEDMANNTGSAFDDIILDTEPPIELSISINDDAQYTNSEDVSLILSAVDNTSSVSQMAFSTDSLNWDAWEPYNTTKSYTLSSGDGPKVVYFKVRDMVNNTALAQDTIVLDTTAPAPISIVINDDEIYTNSLSVTLTLTASDSGSGIAQMAFSTNSLDWTTWETFATTKLFTLENVDGYQNAYFRVSDNAGNLGTDGDTIILDTTPPHSLSISINEGTTETDELNVSLDLTAIDDTSGMNEMAFSTDNITWTAWENYTADKDFTLPTGDGLKTIYFKATDLVGNEALPVFATITLKTTPDVIDSDGDTYPDDQDAFPNDPNEWADTDSDKIGDNADTDDDNDQYLDEWEDFLGTDPKDPLSVPIDTDDDFKPDGDAGNTKLWMDKDDDDDGYTDAEENEEGTDPLDPTNYPTTKKKKDAAEDYSLYLLLLVIIIIIVILVLAVRARGKGEKEPEMPPEEEVLEEGAGAPAVAEEEALEDEEEDFECPTCGAPLKASDTVCTECGEEFEDEEE